MRVSEFVGPRPGWLALAPDQQQRRLESLLHVVGRSKEEQAHRMLAAGPWPMDADDADARAHAVIEYLSTEADR